MKSGVRCVTTKSRKSHKKFVASFLLPNSRMVRPMRDQSATKSPSKQIVIIFKAAKMDIKEISLYNLAQK